MINLALRPGRDNMHSMRWWKPTSHHRDLGEVEIRSRADQLRQATDAELQSHAQDLRAAAYGGLTQAELYSQGIGLCVEAIRRTTNLTLYGVQMLASRSLFHGRVAEMATGEGKSLAAAPAAMLTALRGDPVHVVTANHYLATRDYESIRAAFDLLGISISVLPESTSWAEKTRAYDCEVIYGTAYEFAFDLLRDQRRHQAEPLGTGILKHLDGSSSRQLPRLGGTRVTSIIDEVDHVLIDDAVSPMVLCESSPELAPDAGAHALARRVGMQLNERQHFVRTPRQPFQLTDHAMDWIHDDRWRIPWSQLRRPWREYVLHALFAEYDLRRDVHYIVDRNQIILVDDCSGRILPDRSWSSGLHQALEAKEGLLISAERAAVAQISRQRFFLRHEHLGGMTGTTHGCEQELWQVYGLGIDRIPRRLPCRRKVLETRAYRSQEAKWMAIVAEAKERQRAGQPVLIGTRTIAQSERLGDLLRQHDLRARLLNGRQHVDEARVIAQAGRARTITIATNLAGRGTDIQLDDLARQAGGLHVIVSEPHDVARVDLQLIGRCARQGDPGSARTFVSAEDHLISRYAPHLVQPMKRTASASGELPLDMTSRIRRAQQGVARQQATERAALLRRDQARQSLLDGNEPVRRVARIHE